VGSEFLMQFFWIQVFLLLGQGFFGIRLCLSTVGIHGLVTWPLFGLKERSSSQI